MRYTLYIESGDSLAIQFRLPKLKDQLSCIPKRHSMPLTEHYLQFQAFIFATYCGVFGPPDIFAYSLILTLRSPLVPQLSAPSQLPSTTSTLCFQEQDLLSHCTHRISKDPPPPKTAHPAPISKRRSHVPTGSYFSMLNGLCVRGRIMVL